MLSTGTGKTLNASTPHDLLEQVVSEILTQPLHWDLILDGAVSHLLGSKLSECRVLTVRTSHASKGLLAKLRIQTDVDVSMEDIATSDESKDMAQAQGKFSNSKIAIVGMSGRFPGAADCESLWQLLEQGLDVHRTVPKDRFNVETHYDASGKRLNTSHTPYGCFIEEPGLFDARFFSMSPREAAQTDPMHRLAIVTAYEALEKSGFVPNRTPSTQLSRVGTFYGQTSDDWREVNISQKIDTFFIPGGVRAFAPGRINYFFKFSGPSYSIDTGTSINQSVPTILSLLTEWCSLLIQSRRNPSRLHITMEWRMRHSRFRGLEYSDCTRYLRWSQPRHVPLQNRFLQDIR